LLKFVLTYKASCSLCNFIQTKNDACFFQWIWRLGITTDAGGWHCSARTFKQEAEKAFVVIPFFL
jgi:hypothetical protein